MAAALHAGDEHEAFTLWAQSQNIRIDGVAPARFTGRGLGIVAQRQLKAGEALVFVPSSALLTVESPIVKKLKLPRNCTVHGRIATALTLDLKEKDTKYSSWRATWPTQRDFEQSMAILWEEKLKQLLPWRAKALIHHQEQKLEADLRALKDFIKDEDGHMFRYQWLIVNTRSFYWDFPTVRTRNKQNLSPDDCMALLPFADYFNHQDIGCELVSDVKGCKIVCNRDYQPGEEVYACYGQHSNDFLLVEYGFILDENRWDELKLDPVFTKYFTKSVEKDLEEEGFFGDYTLDSQAVCHRTQVAVRRLMGLRTWVGFLSGVNDGEREQPAVNKKVNELLDEYVKEIQSMTNALEEMSQSEPRDLLLRRWKQIQSLIRKWQDHNPLQ